MVANTNYMAIWYHGSEVADMYRHLGRKYRIKVHLKTSKFRQDEINL
jgi:hypothetical protein